MNETALQYCAYHTLATCSFQFSIQELLIPFQAIGTFASLLTEAESLEREGLLRRRLLMTLSFEEQEPRYTRRSKRRTPCQDLDIAHPDSTG